MRDQTTNNHRRLNSSSNYLAVDGAATITAPALKSSQLNRQISESVKQLFTVRSRGNSDVELVGTTLPQQERVSLLTEAKNLRNSL
jgi:hypothetical protein